MINDQFIIVCYVNNQINWVKKYHSLTALDKNWKYYMSFFPDAGWSGEQSLLVYQVFEDSKQLIIVREKHGKV